MKKIVSLALVTMLIALMAGCAPEAQQPNDPVKVKAAFLPGPTAITMAQMAQEKPDLGDSVSVAYEGIKATDVMNSKLLAGEVDFAVVATNLAAKMYNSDIEYQIASSSVWGVLYMVSNQELTWEDLIGQEIALIGRGLTPDIMLRYLLEQNGINPDEDVTLNYLSGPQELLQGVLTGNHQIAVLPEPLLSTVLMKKEKLVMAMDFQEQWSQATGMESYPQSALVVKKQFAEQHPEVVDSFLVAYKNSINWANDNPAEAGIYSEELNVGLKAKVVEQAIPRSNLRYASAPESQDAVETYLTALLNFAPDSIGGQLPDENFYLPR